MRKFCAVNYVAKEYKKKNIFFYSSLAPTNPPVRDRIRIRWHKAWKWFLSITGGAAECAHGVREVGPGGVLLLSGRLRNGGCQYLWILLRIWISAFSHTTGRDLQYWISSIPMLLLDRLIYLLLDLVFLYSNPKKVCKM